MKVKILRITVLILLVFSYIYRLKILRDSDKYFKHFAEIKDYSVLVKLEFKIENERLNENFNIGKEYQK